MSSRLRFLAVCIPVALIISARWYSRKQKEKKSTQPQLTQGKELHTETKEKVLDTDTKSTAEKEWPAELTQEKGLATVKQKLRRQKWRFATPQDLLGISVTSDVSYAKDLLFVKLIGTNRHALHGSGSEPFVYSLGEVSARGFDLSNEQCAPGLHVTTCDKLDQFAAFGRLVVIATTSQRTSRVRGWGSKLRFDHLHVWCMLTVSELLIELEPSWFSAEARQALLHLQSIQ